MQDETLSTQRKAYVPGKCLSCYTKCPLTDHYRNGGGIGLIMLMLQNLDNLKLQQKKLTAWTLPTGIFICASVKENSVKN